VAAIVRFHCRSLPSQPTTHVHLTFHCQIDLRPVTFTIPVFLEPQPSPVRIAHIGSLAPPHPWEGTNPEISWRQDPNTIL